MLFEAENIDNVIERFKAYSNPPFVMNWLETCLRWKSNDTKFDLSLHHTVQTNVYVGTLKYDEHYRVITVHADDPKDADLKGALKEAIAKLNGNKFYLECIAEEHGEVVDEVLNEMKAEKTNSKLFVTSSSNGNEPTEDGSLPVLPKWLAVPQTDEEARNVDSEEKLLAYAKEMVQTHHKLCVHDDISEGNIRYYSVVPVEPINL